MPVKLKVAVFNSYPFHFEMWGSLLYWASSQQHEVHVYSTTENNYGWVAWYQQVFPFTMHSPTEFMHQAHHYDLVFLPTDYDIGFDDTWLNIYALKHRVIKINHNMVDLRPSIKAYLDIRPYTSHPDRHCAVPTFPINNEPKPMRDIIHVFIGYNRRYQQQDLLQLATQKNLCLHVVGRLTQPIFPAHTQAKIKYYPKCDAAKMVKLMIKCDYMFATISETAKVIDRDELFIEASISGYTPLAFSCGTPMIMTRSNNRTYGFTSTLAYDHLDQILPLSRPDNGEVLAERDELIARMNTSMHRQFYWLLETPSERQPALALVPSKIPKLIHFMWLSVNGREMPPSYQDNIDLWSRVNPEYQVMLWNNAKVDELLRQHYREYIGIYENSPRIITKCDIARTAVLCQYGGIYNDLDFYYTRPIDDLLLGHDLVLFRELPEHETVHSLQICNGFIGCCPGDPFIRGWFYQMMTSLHDLQGKILSTDEVMNTTGPAGFAKYYEKMGSPVPLMDGCLVMPFNNKRRLSHSCSATEPYYAFTLWDEGTGWVGTSMANDGTVNMVLVGVLFLILLAIVIWIILSGI